MGNSAQDVAMAVSKKLSEAMLGRLPGFGPLASPIIDFVFANIFGGSNPDSWVGAILLRVQQIVHQELVADTLSHINGGLHNISQAMYDEYSPAKKHANLTNAKDRQHLFDLLQKYDNTFLAGPDGMLSTLEQHPVEGFTLYLAGVSLRLMIYQEMAITDPSCASPPEWAKSSYGAPDGTVSRFAATSAHTAKQAWYEIQNQRRNAPELYFQERDRSKWDNWGYYYLRDPLSRTSQDLIAQDAVPVSNPYHDEVAAHNDRKPGSFSDKEFWHTAKSAVPDAYWDGLPSSTFVRSSTIPT